MKAEKLFAKLGDVLTYLDHIEMRKAIMHWGLGSTRSPEEKENKENEFIESVYDKIRGIHSIYNINKLMYYYSNHIKRSLRRGYEEKEINRRVTTDTYNKYKNGTIKEKLEHLSYEFYGDLLAKKSNHYLINDDHNYNDHANEFHINNAFNIKRSFYDDNRIMLEMLDGKHYFVPRIRHKISKLIQFRYMYDKGRKMPYMRNDYQRNDYCLICGRYYEGSGRFHRQSQIEVTDYDTVPFFKDTKINICGYCDDLFSSALFKSGYYWCFECGSLQKLNKKHTCDSSKSIILNYKASDKEKNKLQRIEDKKNKLGVIKKEWGF